MFEVEAGCLAKTWKEPPTRKELSTNIYLEPYLLSNGTASCKPPFPFGKEHLIEHQARFHPDKFRTSQLLNLTQHIEDGFEKKKITGAVFVDLTAAYNTVNHRRLIKKVLDMTNDSQLTKFLDVLLKNQRFFVEFNTRKSRVRL